MMRHGPNRQRGVALIVALVILVLVTIAGVATMESTGMELKMANADQDHQQAFEAAETALRDLEVQLQGSSNWQAWSNLYTGCSGSYCFEPDCSNNGLCFEGDWVNGDTADRCSTVPASPPPQLIPPWYDSTLDVWTTSGRYGLVDLSSQGYTNKVKYIIEFRCFVPADVHAALGPGNTNAAELFRITVRAKSNSGNAEVMLQSTYKVL